MVVIAKHPERPWKGSVVVCSLAEDLAKCTELSTARDMPLEISEKDAVAKVGIPPYDVRAVRWE